jgi:AAA domain
MSPFDEMSPEQRMRAGGGKTETHKARAKRGTAYGRLNVYGTDDLDTAEERGYLLKGLISPAEISIWVGPPKCGKSFLMLYIAYQLSLGRSVFGRRVKPTIVLYVAAEGEGGIAKRIKALRNRYGKSPNFHFIAQPADLLHKHGDLDDMKAAAHAIGAQLIVLDTLSRLMAGGDENAPGDMGMFICNVTELRHDTSAHVAIIHHGTKSSNGATPRGHSSLTGADDALVEIMKLEDGSRSATVVHAKDDADGMRWGFDLESVELGRDEDDDPITTLIVNEKTGESSAANKPIPLSNGEKVAMRCFASAMTACQIIEAFSEGEHIPHSVIRDADWRAAFDREAMPGSTYDARRVAYKRAVTSLIAKGVVATRDDFIWQVDKR